MIPWQKGSPVLAQLTCCPFALAAVLPPRGTTLTAKVHSPVSSSMDGLAALHCACFQADWCRDGRAKPDRVIRCSGDSADHTWRLQGVIPHGKSESDVGIVISMLPGDAA